MRSDDDDDENPASETARCAACKKWACPIHPMPISLVASAMDGTHRVRAIKRLSVPHLTPLFLFAFSLAYVPQNYHLFPGSEHKNVVKWYDGAERRLVTSWWQ
jgi:hypothetical protein